MKKFQVIFFLLVLLFGITLPLMASRTQASALISKGWKLIKTNPKEAEEYLLEAVKQSPKWDYPYLLLADLYDQNYLLKDALDAYLKVIKLGISQPSFKFKVYFRVGVLNLTLGNMTEASRYFEKASLLHKNDSKLIKMQQLMKELKKGIRESYVNPKKSVKILQDVIEKKDDLFYALNFLADLKNRQGNVKRASELYRQILSFEPIKNVVLSGDLSLGLKALYYFMRNITNSSIWELHVRFPKGKYEYYIIRNYGYPEQHVFLDKENKKTIKKGSSVILNLWEIKDSFEEHVFRFKTLHRDPIFRQVEMKIFALSKPEHSQTDNSRLFGAGLPGVKTHFHFYAPAAYSVSVVGSFNQWGQQTDPSTGEKVYYKPYLWQMRKTDTNGFWTLDTHLPVGIYPYRYLVNNTVLMKDPFFTVDQTKRIKDLQKLVWGENSFLVVGNWDEVEFRYHAPGAKTVFLVGDFNEWGGTKKGGNLKPEYYFLMNGPDEKGNWHYKLKLSKGSYAYKFVVDSKYWKVDPNAEFYEGRREGRNSIIFVGHKKFPKGKYLGLVELSDNSRKIRFIFNPSLYKRHCRTPIRKVWVVGNFNEWGGKQSFKYYVPGYYYPMKKLPNGSWIFDAILPIGNYQYGFSINGAKKVYPDIKAKKFIKINKFKSNSVLILK